MKQTTNNNNGNNKVNNYIIVLRAICADNTSISRLYKDTAAAYAERTGGANLADVITSKQFIAALNAKYARFPHKEGKPWSAWYVADVLKRACMASDLPHARIYLESVGGDAARALYAAREGKKANMVAAKAAKQSKAAKTAKTAKTANKAA